MHLSIVGKRFIFISIFILLPVFFLPILLLPALATAVYNGSMKPNSLPFHSTPSREFAFAGIGLLVHRYVVQILVYILQHFSTWLQGQISIKKAALCFLPLLLESMIFCFLNLKIGMKMVCTRCYIYDLISSTHMLRHLQTINWIR